MNLWILAFICPISLLVASTYAATTRSYKLWPLLTSLFLFFASLGIIIAFCCFRTTSTQLYQKENKVEKLIRMDDYFLMQDEDEFRYILEDGLRAQAAKIKNSSIYYGSSDGRVIAYKITNIVEENWWIFSAKHKSLVREYDFYIPDRDSIKFEFEEKN